MLDFGAGRKLEQFGSIVIDRPAPAATGEPRDPTLWETADWQFRGDKIGGGEWTARDPDSEETSLIDCPIGDNGGFRLALDRLPNGQVGLFPEQFPNWKWIANRATRAGRTIRLLNLFGYTGGSTLAAAVAGAEVTHVDASRPAVKLARRNAELSGLGDQPIRWVVEEAVKYAAREVKRGSHYDAIVLDPPSYGHGPKGEAWQLTRDLPKLLRLCRDLTQGAPQFVLLTCHTQGIGQAELSAYVADGMFGHCGAPPKTERLWLRTAGGRKLPSGISARWPA